LEWRPIRDSRLSFVARGPVIISRAPMSSPRDPASGSARLRRRVGDLAAQLTTHGASASSADPGSSAYAAALRACRSDLAAFIDEHNAAPILLRLAWHDAGTYDASVGTWPACGGANGSIRFDPEMAHGANAGLSKALGYLKPFKARHATLSWADLIQLAGATAVETAGGPKIPMRYGRVDVTGPEQCPKEGNLPDAEAPFGDGSRDAASHLRAVFGRMGFDDREIVALSGAHTVGRAFAERSGTSAFGYGAKRATRYTGGCPFAPRKDGREGLGMPGGQSWTRRWLAFDNAYFRKEYVDEPKDLLWLSTDEALHTDPGFAPHFRRYAESQDAFFEDFAAAFAKLSERGARFRPACGVRLE
jgi:L-ascorbate peroxidase